MGESTRETIVYYDANAAVFVADTAGVEFGELQREFARRLGPSSTFASPSCSMDQNKLVNQPKMIHPARMARNRTE